MSKPLLLSLLGATASGKTAVAVEAAQAGDAASPGLEILSADSRQVYRRLDLGTAKPTAEERRAAPHHLIDVADPEETYTAARFGREARACAEEVRSRGNVPFLVGGSGLYLRAAESGLFEGPAADADLRARLSHEAETRGDVVLHGRLAVVDAATAARVAAADRVRVIRALEVFELTGVPLSEHHRRHREAESPFRCVRFGIEWEPAALARRIEARVDEMLASGWVAEVEGLLAAGLPADAPAWKAHGYPEIRRHLAGELTLAEARERIVTITRQFAKRQRTWFRAVKDVTWFRVESADGLVGLGSRIRERLELTSA